MPSRRNAIAMTDDEAKEFIETGWTLQVASVRPQRLAPPGRHVVRRDRRQNPLHHLRQSAKRCSTLKRDPRITVMLESGTEYSKIKGLVIEGEAEVVENDPDLVIAVQDATGRKRSPNAGAQAATPMTDDQRRAQAAKRAVVRITPSRIYSWDHEKLGGRY